MHGPLIPATCHDTRQQVVFSCRWNGRVCTRALFQCTTVRRTLDSVRDSNTVFPVVVPVDTPVTVPEGTRGTGPEGTWGTFGMDHDAGGLAAELVAGGPAAEDLAAEDPDAGNDLVHLDHIPAAY